MKEGPAAAMEGLYQHHGPAILRYLQRRFGRAASAEDLLQETFVRALGNQRGLAGAASPRAFLFGIARHVGLAAARRARLMRVETFEEAAARDESDPALAEMRAAIARLPEQIRETLEFRLRDELSYEEIAAVLRIPVGTVRSRLHTAVRLLRDELNPGEAM
ncbi:MAG TPA: sigma-70 family RNA polymerase sigma factor [Phycisphaerae bacterium]|nr:sigma-70 family RNA polymerase sigma factor [Phycisphaerae bacterium]